MNKQIVLLFIVLLASCMNKRSIDTEKEKKNEDSVINQSLSDNTNEREFPLFMGELTGVDTFVHKKLSSLKGSKDLLIYKITIYRNRVDSKIYLFYRHKNDSISTLIFFSSGSLMGETSNFFVKNQSNDYPAHKRKCFALYLDSLLTHYNYWTTVTNEKEIKERPSDQGPLLFIIEGFKDGQYHKLIKRGYDILNSNSEFILQLYALLKSSMIFNTKSDLDELEKFYKKK